MTVSLLIIYINRGLFVAQPGLEISCTPSASSSEINSLLEMILNLADIHNHIDEDGDSSEAFDAAKIFQPLIDQSITDACTVRHYSILPKTLYPTNETIHKLYIYGTIDHPPDVA